jgi:hypothetical protein
MADKAQNRAAALKLYNGESLTQNEERALTTARNQAGSEGNALNRIIGGGKA